MTAVDSKRDEDEVSVAELPPWRKAAVVIAALGPEAEALLAQLPPEVAQALRQQAARITLTGSEEESAIIGEFLSACNFQFKASTKFSSFGGRQKGFDSGLPTQPRMSRPQETASSAEVSSPWEASGKGGAVSVGPAGQYWPVNSSTISPAKASVEQDGKTGSLWVRESGRVPEVTSGENARPFDRLRASEAAAIARILATERAQTIALVLSHLPPEQASQVLSHFPPPQQVEIIHRLVDLEETDPEILREIERTLEMRLAQIVQAGRRRRAGLAAVRTIVAAADRSTRGQILGNLETFDRDLARQLAPPLPEFEDLVLLDEPALRALVQSAEPLVLQLALVGAPEVLLRRVMSVLPSQERALLQSRLQELGPTSLRDVDEARNRLCRLAHRLAVTGQIDLPLSFRSLNTHAIA